MMVAKAVNCIHKTNYEKLSVTRVYISAINMRRNNI